MNTEESDTILVEGDLSDYHFILIFDPDKKDYLTTQTEVCSGLEINMTNHTWVYMGEAFDIGEHRPIHGQCQSVVGVYFKRNIDHINLMMNAPREYYSLSFLKR